MKKKIEFKQHYLEPLQNLDVNLQRKILSQVMQGSMSVPQMQAEGKQLRSMKIIKETFLRLELHAYISTVTVLFDSP